MPLVSCVVIAPLLRDILRIVRTTTTADVRFATCTTLYCTAAAPDVLRQTIHKTTKVFKFFKASV